MHKFKSGNNRQGRNVGDKDVVIIIDCKLNMIQCGAVANKANVILAYINKSGMCVGEASAGLLCTILGTML